MNHFPAFRIQDSDFLPFAASVLASAIGSPNIDVTKDFHMAEESEELGILKYQ
jgi:hypothetical protein